MAPAQCVAVVDGLLSVVMLVCCDGYSGMHSSPDTL